MKPDTIDVRKLEGGLCFVIEEEEKYGNGEVKRDEKLKGFKCSFI